VCVCVCVCTCVPLGQMALASPAGEEFSLGKPTIGPLVPGAVQAAKPVFLCGVS
jgi:hypothetical protein